MLPAPTAEGVLIMSALTAFTDGMSTKKCARFRRSMRSGLSVDNAKVRFIRKMVPASQQAQEQAATLLRIGCGLCLRRSDCASPLT